MVLVMFLYQMMSISTWILSAQHNRSNQHSRADLRQGMGARWHLWLAQPLLMPGVHLLHMQEGVEKVKQQRSHNHPRTKLPVRIVMCAYLPHMASEQCLHFVVRQLEQGKDKPPGLATMPMLCQGLMQPYIKPA